MAFDRQALTGNVGAGASAPSLYLYSTNDTLAVVEGADYFNDVADVLEVHDIIQVDGATFGIYTVTTNDGSAVTVTASAYKEA